MAANRISTVAVNESIHGLLLTGGRSRRLGSDKALLLNDGETQLSRAVGLLRELLPAVFVSVRPDQADDAERSRYPQIVDRYEDMGPVAGILSAMDRDADKSWLVLACDLPNVDAATISFLIENVSEHDPFTAFASSADGLPEPLCAIYQPAAADIVRRFAAEGVICPRKMMIRSATHLLEQPNPSALENVNTPEDLQRSRASVA